MIGNRISHFRILAKLGEGGMGVVYKAEDEKLGRPVALKVLRGGLGAAEEGRLRLIREARTAAALHHPHIAAIHEIDEADGVVFIAMEYVEGKTLRSVLGGRPVEIRQALKIAEDIAEGLARAHRGRIVHRDLKPENVMIASDGEVKILDFGLAKLLRERSEDYPSEISKLDTISADRSLEGRIVGTVAYMSPEQARGQPLDVRSDLFSFGIVLYEMLAGRTPFKGSTEMDTLTAIIRERAIPALELNSGVPLELERILEKCLEKDPADRYQDTGDLVVDLRRLMRSTDTQPQGRSEATVPKPAGRLARRLPRTLLTLSLLAVAVAAVSIGWFAWRHQMSTQTPPSAKLNLRQITAFPQERALDSAAISPDGKYLAYKDDTGLQLLSIDTGESRHLPLVSSERRSIDFISWFPDGTRLLLSDSSEQRSVLFSYSVMSGTERRLRGDATGDEFGVVSPDGSLIAFTDTDRSGIWIMTATGEEVRQIVRAELGESVGPSVWAPDGRRLAYRLGAKDEHYYTGAIKSVDTQGRGGTLIAQATLSVSVPFCWIQGRVLYSDANPGVVSAESSRLVSHLWEIGVDDRSGRPAGAPRKLTSLTGFDLDALTASQDGDRLAFVASRWQDDVYVGRLEDDGARLEAPRRLTLDDRGDWPTAWLPNGRSVLFGSYRHGTPDIFKQDLESPTAEIVYTTAKAEWWATPTSDGSSLLLGQWHSEDPDAGQGTYKVLRLPLSGGPPHVLIEADVGSEENYGAKCSHGLCVLCEQRRKELAFYALDPDKGKGREICRVAGASGWDISPDRARIAVVDYDGRLRTISVSDGTVRATAISAAGWSRFESISWTHDGAHLFVTGQSGGDWGILRVDLKGNASVLWRQPHYISDPIPSPDGRFLAMEASSYEANAWLIENF